MTNPRRRAGTTGFVLGLAVAGLGVYLLNLCTWSFAGSCVQRGYSTPGLIVALAGLLGAAMSLVWVRGAWAFPDRSRSDLYCDVCGARLRWVRDSDGWYCDRCGHYRLQAGGMDVGPRKGP